MSGVQAASAPAGRNPESEISSRERQEILVRINELVAGARKPAGGGDRAFRAARSGALFPLLVNLGAAALIAAGVYFLPRLFDRTEQTIVAQTAEKPAGEERIVSAVVREGEEKLAAKDREIIGIQSRIGDLGRELVSLRTGRDAEIARREQALRDALAVELAAERQRLEKTGTASASLEKQLSTLDQKRTTELEQQLAAYRKQMDVELAAKEKEIDARFAAYQRDLAVARNARTLLEKDLAESQASGAAAVSEQQRLARELAAVTEQSRREELALGQLTTAWQSVNGAMKAGLWDKALLGLDAITGLLAQDSVASLPAVQRRAAVDGFLVESMRRLVAADRGDPAAGGAAAAAQEAASLVVQAEAKFTDGDTKAARELYLAAIAKLPALQTAYERLSGMDAGGTAPSRQAVANAVALADASYAAGNWNTALDRYEKALGLLKDMARDLPRAASRIADAGYRQTTADQAVRQDRSAHTLIEKADGLVRRGDLDEALVTYASVVDSYPLSSQVKNAVAGISSVVDARIKQKEDEITALEQSLANAQALEKSALADAAAKDKVASDALAREKARQDAEGKAAAAAQEKIKNLNDSLAAAARRGSQAADAARKELISLLQAKVLVKEALNADAVKTAHPGLADSLDRYIELYAEQKKGEGVAVALSDVTGVADYLLGKKTSNDISGMWARYAEDTQRSALQQVLDRLKALAP
ncbi:MAG: hypothetical protein A2177_00925 [Spirochaetes bacterium RBG_13_68_11]|nr:MAG: hypothetical protein A2177_00925 [Spirochaetes bacterium RBG_13_68_11]